MTTADSANQKLYDANFLLTMLVACVGTGSWLMLLHFGRVIRFLGGDEFTIGLILCFAALMVLPLWPVVSALLDRLGFTYVWMVGLLLLGASLAAWTFDLGLGWQAYLARGFAALGWAFNMVAISTYAARIAPADRQSEAIGTMGIGGFVGALGGAILGNHLLGPEATRTLDHCRSLIQVSAGLAICAASLTLFLRKFPRFTGPEAPSLRNPWRQIARHKAGWVMLIPLAMSLCFIAHGTFVGLMADERNLRVDFYFIAFSLSAIFFRIVGRRLPSIIGETRLATIGLLLYNSAWLVMPLMPPGAGWWLLLPGIIAGTGHSLLFPCAIHLVAIQLGPRQRTLGTTLAVGTAESGVGLGGPIFGYIARQSSSLPLSFVAIGLTAVGIGLIGIEAARRRLQTPELANVSQADLRVAPAE